MRNISCLIAVRLLIVSARSARADALAIETVFRTALREHDDSRLPSETQFGLALTGSSESLTPVEMQSLLPLAEQRLVSDRRAIQGYAISFFCLAALRMDGANLVHLTLTKSLPI